MSESSTRNGTSAIRRRQAGLCFAVLAGQFITVIMLAASMAPGYDAAAAAISDLGVIPETAAVFNASLIATGALNTLGAVILFTADRRRTALVVATIAGIGAIGAGTVTLATPGIHGLFALLAFIFFNLEVLSGAIAMRGAIRAIGLGLGLLGLAYVVVMFVGDSGVPQVFGAIGHGGTERMIVYPPMLWLLVYGGALLATEDERRTVLISGGLVVAAVAGTGGLTIAEMGDMRDYEASVAASRASLAATPDFVELVRCGTLAANSHNTQPWRFRVHGTQIDITPDTSRRTPVVDPDDHHLFISLGCAAENIAVAGGARGRPVSVAFSGDDGGIVSCSVGVGRPVSSDLADAIPARQSTRADYDGQQVSAAAISELVVAAHVPGVEVAIVTERPALDRLRDLVIAANTRQMSDPAFIGELKHWLRFNPRQALAAGDGLFSACSGNPQLPTWIAGTVFDWFVTADSENARYQRQIDSSSGIAVFFSEQDNADHWVRVGRAFERFALEATAMGIKTAHLNQPVEVAAFRSDLARLAGNPGSRPFLTVRFGRGPVLPYSVRRPLGDVLA